MIVLSLPKEDQSYTYADYLSWPEEERVEILGGRPYLQAAPSRIHQKVLSEIHRQIANYLLDRECEVYPAPFQDRKSTRLNSSHVAISYAVFCLKKKNKTETSN